MRAMFSRNVTTEDAKCDYPWTGNLWIMYVIGPVEKEGFPAVHEHYDHSPKSGAEPQLDFSKASDPAECMAPPKAGEDGDKGGTTSEDPGSDAGDSDKEPSSSASTLTATFFGAAIAAIF